MLTRSPTRKSPTQDAARWSLCEACYDNAVLPREDHAASPPVVLAWSTTISIVAGRGAGGRRGCHSGVFAFDNSGILVPSGRFRNTRKRPTEEAERKAMNSKPESVLALAPLLGMCLLLDGCGGKSSGGDGGGAGGDGQASASSICGTFTACGGSVVGTWTVSSICLDSPQGYPSCPGFQHSGQLQYSGTITFSSSGTYTRALTRSGTVVSTYPMTCFAGIACAQLSSSLFQPDAGYTGSCSSNGDACVCSLTYDGPENEQGTYATEGNSIVMSSGASSGDEQGEYCVQGNQLTVRSTSSRSRDSATMVATNE